MFATSLLDVFSMLTIDIQVTIQTSFERQLQTSKGQLLMLLLCLFMTHIDSLSHSISFHLLGHFIRQFMQCYKVSTDAKILLMRRALYHVSYLASWLEFFI